jgi:hypothetical protein
MMAWSSVLPNHRCGGTPPFKKPRIDCGSLKSIAVCSEQILRYSADEGGPMRKVVAMELVSLDGVLEGHGGVPGL